MRRCHERQRDVKLADRLLVGLERHAGQLRRHYSVEQLQLCVAQTHADAFPLIGMEDALLKRRDQRQGRKLKHVAVDNRPRVKDDFAPRLILVDSEKFLPLKQSRGAGVVEYDCRHSTALNAADVVVKKIVSQWLGRKECDVIHRVGFVGDGKERAAGEKIRFIILNQIEKRPTAERVADLLCKVGRIPDRGHAQIVGRHPQRLLAFSDVLHFKLIKQVLHAGIFLEPLPKALHAKIEIIKQHHPHVEPCGAQKPCHLKNAKESG